MSDWDGPAWLTVPGARLASVTTARTPKSPAPKAFIKNQFEALSEEGPVDDSDLQHGSSCNFSETCGGMKVSLADAFKMLSRNKLKAARRMKAFEESEKENMKPNLMEKKSAEMDDQVLLALAPRGEGWQGVKPLPSIEVADPNQKEKPTVMSVAWPGLKVLTEKRPHTLMPMAGANDGGWEHLEAILDSGATVTVIPPHVGREYEVVPGVASKAGVKCEVANGEEIQNLCEKLLLVVTDESSWRGMLAQVADVSKALQSVRAVVKAGHVVVFGDGECGADRYIYNKVTGETNLVKDDGVN